MFKMNKKKVSKEELDEVVKILKRDVRNCVRGNQKLEEAVNTLIKEVEELKNTSKTSNSKKSLNTKVCLIALSLICSGSAVKKMDTDSIVKIVEVIAKSL